MIFDHANATGDMLREYRRAVYSALDLLHDARHAIRVDNDEQEAFLLIGRVMPILLSAIASEEINYRFWTTTPDATNLSDLDFG